MNSRTLPLNSIEDFFQLLDITDRDDWSALFDNYTQPLSQLIKSVDDAIKLFSKLSYYDDISKVCANQPDIVLAAFDNASDFIKLAKHSYNVAEHVIATPSSKLTKKIFSLFTEPESIVELTDSSVSVAAQLFQQHVPCAKKLISSHNAISSLCLKSKRIIDTVAEDAVNLLTDHQQPTLEDIYNLAFLFNAISVKNASSKSADYYRKEEVKTEDFLKTSFKQFLLSTTHQALVATLTEQNNFLHLFNISKQFADIMNEQFHLYEPLTKDLTFEELCSRTRENPAIIKCRVTKYSNESNVVDLLKSTVQIRIFHQLCRELGCEIHLSEFKFAKLFAVSNDIEDWLWLAKTDDGYLNEYTLQHLRDNQIPAILLNARAIIQLVSINPAFTSRLITTMHKESLVPIFKNPEILWDLLQADTKRRLIWICKTAIARHSEFLEYIFLRSANFTLLDNDLLRNLLESSSRFIEEDTHIITRACFELLVKYEGAARVMASHKDFFDYFSFAGYQPADILRIIKTANDLSVLVKSHHVSCVQFARSSDGNLNSYRLKQYIQSPECRLPDLIISLRGSNNLLSDMLRANRWLVITLFTHHTEKMLPLFDLKTFMQLELHHDDSTIEMFTRYAEEFAYLFVAGKSEDQLELISKKTGIIKALEANNALVKLLMSRHPYIMAQTFSGAAFVNLIKIAPSIAALLLAGCKDDVTRLIPTAADLAEVNKVNAMLMRQFAQKWPDKVPVYPNSVAVQATSAPLPTIVNNWSTLHTHRRDEVDAPNEKMAASASGMKPGS